jgi:hypothetical protein
VRFPKHARLMVVIAVLAAFAAFAFVGCGGSSAGPTSTNASGMAVRHYSNTTYKFSFDYPANWQINTDISKQSTSGAQAAFNVGAFDPKGTIVSKTQIDGAAVSIYNLQVTIDSSNLGDIRPQIEAAVNQLTQSTPGVKTLAALSNTTVNGISGFTVTYSFPYQNTPVVSALYFLFKGNREYQLTLQSAETLWQKLQPQMKSVTDSFTVTG